MAGGRLDVNGAGEADQGEETYTTTLDLVPDSRATYTADDRAVKQKTSRRLYDMLFHIPH